MSGIPPNIGAELAALQAALAAKEQALAGVESALAAAEHDKTAVAADLAAEKAAHAATARSLAGVQADLARYTAPLTEGGVTTLTVAVAKDGSWHKTPAEAQRHDKISAIAMRAQIGLAVAARLYDAGMIS